MTSCVVMLCHGQAAGLVRVSALARDIPEKREVPACEACADAIAGLLARGHVLGITAGGALYDYTLVGQMAIRRR